MIRVIHGTSTFHLAVVTTRGCFFVCVWGARATMLGGPSLTARPSCSMRAALSFGAGLSQVRYWAQWAEQEVVAAKRDYAEQAKGGARSKASGPKSGGG